MQAGQAIVKLLERRKVLNKLLKKIRKPHGSSHRNRVRIRNEETQKGVIITFLF